MSKPGRQQTWVVYSQPVHGQEEAVSAVCEQGEWDALEVTQPGRRTLIQSGIVSEAEAERKELPPNLGLCQIKFQLEQIMYIVSN